LEEYIASIFREKKIENEDNTFLGTGRDSSAGITTGYGVDDPGIEYRLGRVFSHMSRPDLRPNLSPAKWVPGLFRG
jgi:hypothetical protein